VATVGRIEFREESLMHILAGIVTILGIIGVVLWRLHMAAVAAKGLAETANDARGLFRRWRWQRKFASNPLDLVQDPREAVVAMMVAVAQSDGAMTDRERQVIMTELVARIGATERQAEELLAHGRWLTRDVRDIDHCLDKLAPLIKRQCSPEQNRDVLQMLYNVASAEGRPGEIEGAALARISRALRD
jgi:uncharacterized tellurite resistance protein B-like protein